jgi:NAD(P)-dependent dehydrogenase (short-subunit alcohol dehydrogenase family)
MGATVILASRTPKKMEETKAEILKLYPDSIGTLVAEQKLDTADLDNVVSFVQWFRSKYRQLHYLVNNAGTLYTPPHDTFDPKNPPTSKQGYELAFVTNYLGHFLLTQLLIPTMLQLPATSKARIVNVASSAHVTVDGSDLNCQPSPNGLTSPIASRPCEKMSQWLSAYGNNKSAMLIHTKETQLELNQMEKTNVKVQFTIFSSFFSLRTSRSSPLVLDSQPQEWFQMAL